MAPDGFIFPNVMAFMVGGVLLGFFLAGLLIAYLEFARAAIVTPLSASSQLGIQLLGSLPSMMTSSQKKP